jgi:hypothetical protein
MRLHNISTIEEANLFLPQFLNSMNTKFGKKAANPENAHRPLRSQDNLKKIFARKDIRKLSKDLTFQHQGILYMIETKTPNRLKHATVQILHTPGEAIEVYYQEIKLTYKKWSETTYQQPQVLTSKEVALQQWLNKKHIKPRRYHPWR